VSRQDVEEALERQDTTLEPGDIAMLYFGFERQRRAMGGRFPAESGGLEGSSASFWVDAGLLALVADNPAIEPVPGDYAIHIALLRNAGIPLGELWALEQLADACRADGRYTCAVASAPLNIHGAFGSTANAIAIR
jgi:kynurenine formamidase